jgi:hypothetical protein
MANLNAPRGFVPYKKEGKCYKTREYDKTAATEIFKGDLLKRAAAGTVEPYVAGDAEPVVGVAANYSAAANTNKIAVYDDPEAEFVVETAGTFDLADRGLNADIAAAPSGDADLGFSGQAVDMATKAATATLPIKVLELANPINQEDNNAGEANADIVVKINRHERGNLQTGI